MDLDDITIEQVFMFLACLIGVAIVMSIFVHAVRKSQENENNKLPLQKKRAKVLEKVPNTALDVFVVFETDDGQRVRLNTKEYTALVVGDRGTLTWRGTKLISFDLDREN